MNQGKTTFPEIQYLKIIFLEDENVTFCMPNIALRNSIPRNHIPRRWKSLHFA